MKKDHRANRRGKRCRLPRWTAADRERLRARHEAEDRRRDEEREHARERGRGHEEVGVLMASGEERPPPVLHAQVMVGHLRRRILERVAAEERAGPAPVLVMVDLRSKEGGDFFTVPIVAARLLPEFKAFTQIHEDPPPGARWVVVGFDSGEWAVIPLVLEEGASLS